jgi:hypothetical protein
MKKFFICLALIFSVHMISRAQEGLHFGGGLSYNADSLMRALGVQAKLSGSISDKFVIHGAGTYFFRKETYFAIDADLHYQFINYKDKFAINPFAGINLSRTTKTNTSLNLGASILIFNDNFHYYLEPKFIIDDSQFLLSMGIMI